MARVTRLLSLAWLLVMLGPAVLAVLLLVVAATWRGQLFAVVALGIVATPLVGLRFAVSRTRAWSIGSLIAVGCTTVGLVTLIAAVPTPRAPAETGAFSVFPAGTSRLALTTLLPEFDQLVLGSHLVAYSDPYPHYDELSALAPPLRRRLPTDARGPAVRDAPDAAGRGVLAVVDRPTLRLRPRACSR